MDTNRDWAHQSQNEDNFPTFSTGKTKTIFRPFLLGKTKTIFRPFLLG